MDAGEVDHYFDEVETDSDRDHPSRLGWPNAPGRLGEMKRCLTALAHTKTFKIDMYVYDGQFGLALKRIMGKYSSYCVRHVSECMEHSKCIKQQLCEWYIYYLSTTLSILRQYS